MSDPITVTKADANLPWAWLLRLRNRHFFVLDILLLSLTPFIALALRLGGFEPIQRYVVSLALFSLLGLIIKITLFWKAGLYVRYWRYASVDELVRIVIATSLASLLLNLPYYLVVVQLFPKLAIPRSVGPIDFLLTLLIVGGGRFTIRLAEEKRRRSLGLGKGQPTLVIGAGDAGCLIVRELYANPKLGLTPVGFIDDDPGKQGLMILELPVLGNRNQIEQVTQQYGIRQAIIAMPTAPGKTIRDLVNRCITAGLPVRTVPGIFEILGGQVTVNQIRNVEIEDLLRREPVQIDDTAVHNLLIGRRILVTGAGGSIGSELCRQIARHNPATLILLGHGEHSIFQLAQELASAYPHLPVTRAIADIRDAERIARLFARYQPQIIFHAAAHKHVPLMEENVEEAITNNILGTRTVTRAATANGVERLVLISTDKAVNPTSIMGASKRVAELIVCQEAQRQGRNYVSVRFGNVLGSRGSVVNIFREQIARGGPVTVTHPEMRRYFMTIPEAVQLVLQAVTLGNGGEVFVLDMGEPVKIVDLARDLIRLSGLEIGRDIDIVFSGIRPGEKLFEELFCTNDHDTRTRHDKIFVARNGGNLTPPGADNLDTQIDALIAAAYAGDPTSIRHWLKRIVPEYQT